MEISLAYFWENLLASPALVITSILTLAVVLVNGWTDAPNAIATCISTRSMSPRAAIAMATVFNFLGVLVMTVFNTTVAQTIYKMVDFGGNTQRSFDSSLRCLVCHCIMGNGRLVVWNTD